MGGTDRAADGVVWQRCRSAFVFAPDDVVSGIDLAVVVVVAINGRSQWGVKHYARRWQLVAVLKEAEYQVLSAAVRSCRVDAPAAPSACACGPFDPVPPREGAAGGGAVTAPPANANAVRAALVATHLRRNGLR